MAVGTHDDQIHCLLALTGQKHRVHLCASADLGRCRDACLLQLQAGELKSLPRVSGIGTDH